LKANWFGLISAILIFASLFLPYLSFTVYEIVGEYPNLGQDYSLNAGLSMNYFGFVGNANGITHISLFPYWFNWVFCATLLIAGLIALKGSFTKRTVGPRLMLFAGVLAIICSPLFYVALITTLSSLGLLSNSTLFTIFSPSDFGLNIINIDKFHSRISQGFSWLPIIAGVLAIVSTKFFKAKNP
jgi:hypothetical protein